MKKYIKDIIQIIELILKRVQSNTTPRQFMLLSSVLVGISASLAVVALKSFAHWVFLLAQHTDRILKLPFGNSILPIIGILLTVFVTKRFLGGTIEKGLSQIMFAVAKKESYLPRKQMYAQIITNSLTVGFGGSAGVESPTAITSAAFGSNFAKHYKLSYKDRTLLLACGVAAGTAAAFNAPIAGVLFAIEVILADMSITAFIPIMISAATGAIISAILLNEGILLSFSEKQSFEFQDVIFYIILGVITGWFAVFYSRRFQKIMNYFQKMKGSVYKKAMQGALLLAILIFVIPTLFGQGYESIMTLSGDSPSDILKETLFANLIDYKWALLLFVGLAAFLKVFATGFTLGSGGNGGNFAPSLFAGSYLGFLFSEIVNSTKLIQLPVSSFTIVGMAGVFSGLFHAPLTAIFLIGEITGGYTLMIPLLIVSSISFAMSKNLEKHSMDIKLLAKKGHVFTANKDRNVLSTIPIDNILITNYKTIHPDDTLEKLVQLLTETDQHVFAVVNDQNELVGIVEFNQVRTYIFNSFKVKYTKVKEIMSQAEWFVFYENTVFMMLQKLESSHQEELPVLKDNKYYGFVSKIKILENYRDRQRDIRIE